MGLLGRLVVLCIAASGIGFLSQLTSAKELRHSMRQDWPTSRAVQKEVLTEIVQPVKTETEFADRSVEFNVGSGFAVGRYFFTVYHNILASRDRFIRKTTSVGGIALRPVFLDEIQDIAIFELTGELCRRICNGLEISAAPILEHGRPVLWVRKTDAQWEIKESRILNIAAFDRLRPGVRPESGFRCADNLVVEVEKPFMPGSSGAPVVDALTGQIIGIIQGSFESDDERTGFFKPIHCVGFRQALYAPRGSRTPG